MPRRCLGLIGGIGVGATVFYDRALATAFEEEGEPLRLLLAHADMQRVLGHVRAGEIAELAGYLGDLMASLRAGGAEIGAISAATPHICVDEVTARSRLQLVSLVDALDAEIGRQGVRRVALFGTRFVVESDMFGRITNAQVVRPKPDEIEMIHTVYSSVAAEGRISPDGFKELMAIARTLHERDDVEKIVIAGTDLSTIFGEEDSPFPSIDCSSVHVRAIVDAIA